MPYDRMTLVMFRRECVDVTELTRNRDPVLRHPDPRREKELYAAAIAVCHETAPVLLKQALIGTPAAL